MKTPIGAACQPVVDFAVARWGGWSLESRGCKFAGDVDVPLVTPKKEASTKGKALAPNFGMAVVGWWSKGSVGGKRVR